MPSLSDLTKPAAGVVDLMEALLPIEGRKPVKEMAAKKPASKVGLPSASKVGSIAAAAPKLIVCGLKFAAPNRGRPETPNQMPMINAGL